MVSGPGPGKITAPPGIGEIAADQERKGREHGQDVGRYLRTGGREKEKYQPRPEEEKQGVAVLMPFLPGGGQAVFYGLDEEGAPGKQPYEHDRDEVPGRMIPAVHFGQVAEEVLPDDIKIEKLGVGPLGEDVPRRRDQQKEGKARRQLHGLEHAPFSEQDDPCPHNHGGDEDADEALGQDRQRGEGIEAPEQKPPSPAPGLAYACEEGQQRSRKKYRNRHIKDDHPAQSVIQEAGRQDGGGKEPAPPAEEARAREIDR